MNAVFNVKRHFFFLSVNVSMYVCLAAAVAVVCSELATAPHTQSMNVSEFKFLIFLRQRAHLDAI